jgi:hypothetical protein
MDNFYVTMNAFPFYASLRILVRTSDIKGAGTVRPLRFPRVSALPSGGASYSCFAIILTFFVGRERVLVVEGDAADGRRV